MPSITTYLVSFAVISYFMGMLTENVFMILVGIYLLWYFIRRFIKELGFVSKTNYNILLKSNVNLTKEINEMETKYKELDDIFRPVLEKYGDNFVSALKIEGQDSVFKVYMFNRTKFDKHLQIFMADLQIKEEKIRRQAEARANYYRKYHYAPREPAKASWRDTLGVSSSADYAETKAAYRTLVKKYHPDNAGGDEVKIREVNAAWDEAEKFFGK